MRTSGSSVGLLAAKGPKGGDAAVFVDGRRVGTVNLSASKVRTGQQVWVSQLSPGYHDVRIVNLAPKGRPSITIEGLSVS